MQKAHVAMPPKRVLDAPKEEGKVAARDVAQGVVAQSRWAACQGWLSGGKGGMPESAPSNPLGKKEATSTRVWLR